MILIGSMAAALGGFLPPYRAGLIRDIDIVCQADELLDLARLTGLKLKQVAPDKFLVVETPRVVELTVYPDDAAEAIAGLCDVAGVELSAEVRIDCHVAPLEVVWATLAGSVPCILTPRDKSLLDAAHYQALVDERGSLRPEHHDLADFYRRRTLAQLTAATGSATEE